MTTTTTPPAPPAVDGRQTREAALQLREVSTEGRTFTALAVPWDTRTAIGDPAAGWGYWESFDRDAELEHTGAIVFWRHREPVGPLTAQARADEGWIITGRLSETAAGNDALALLRDGVPLGLSLGFDPVEHRETTDPETGQVHVTRTRVIVREVSLTPAPAYTGTRVLDLRETTTAPPAPPTAPPTLERETTTMDTLTADHPVLTELRETVEDLGRKVATASFVPPAPTGPQFRSAGALLKALVAGNADAIAEYQGTLARERAEALEGRDLATAAGNVTRNGWVGDLTRIVDEPSRLRRLFSTGALPAEGQFLEYGQLKSNTITVGKQAAEGANLPFGKVETETKTAPVETFGGYTTLSFQAIQRASVNVLNHSLRALTVAANRGANARFRTHYDTARAAQVTAGNTVAVTDVDAYGDWLDAIVDAAIAYEALGLPLEALVVDPVIFKRLGRITDTAGRPLMVVDGEGVNAVGRFNAKGLSGSLAGVTVELNPGQAAVGAAFVNGEAIRTYQSPLSQLQDENVVNLSKDFSVYHYAALADEIPAAIVPVAIAEAL